MNRSSASTFRLVTLIAFSAGSVSSTLALADDRPFLHPLFSDHMVLQRGVKTRVWGWTEPGATVEVSVATVAARTRAEPDGRWTVHLAPLPAGGPHRMKISGPASREVNDILVGDVWICSGQSNMEWSVRASKDPDREIAAANHPKIRLFKVPRRISDTPRATVDASWSVCQPETIASFTAVGYYFGRSLHESLDVPIGLIQSAWGGTVAEAWTSARALRTMDDFRAPVERFVAAAEAKKKGKYSFERELSEWYRTNDPGSAPGRPSWAAVDLDASAWRTMSLPTQWERAGFPDFDGLMWFRREVTIPESWAGKKLTLDLGPIDDADSTFFNGIEIGSTADWRRSRRYSVPASAVRAGRNIIAIRVLDTGGGGGIYGEAAQMRLRAGADANPISLAGEWRFRPGKSVRETGTPPRPAGSNPNVTTVLYNGMIAPLVPYAIKGAIWYQGESNAGRPAQYRTLLPTMIADWRSRFGVGDFPFFIVQLANFMARNDKPTESNWAELREAQSLTAANDPKVGVAVIIDIGEANDIHPKNKQDVGRRLALSARGIAYGEKIVHSGPTAKGARADGNSMVVEFDHVGGGLVARGGGELKGFAIAGDDGKFVWAEAEIRGSTIVVSSPKVERPVAVRYAWANNPECNLYNQEGLPASPFRTDGPE